MKFLTCYWIKTSLEVNVYRLRLIRSWFWQRTPYLTTKTLSHKCTSVHRENCVKHWIDKLSKLTVQNKFTAIIDLESQNSVWKCIQKGMPAGQLSFLLRAGSDTLPTPLNLRHWRLRPDAKCPLCDNPWSTVQRILNGCPVSLTQGRYTWWHDGALKILANGLRECLQPYTQIYRGWEPLITPNLPSQPKSWTPQPARTLS